MVNDAVSLTPAMSIMAHIPSNNSATDNSGVLKRVVKYREKPMATVAPPITLPAMMSHPVSHASVGPKEFVT